MKIVGIAGRKGAGKDTAAQALIARGYENVKFAGALKAMMYAFADYVGMSKEEADRRIEGDLKEEPCEHLCGKSFRYAMQMIGTEWGRVLIGDTIWTEAFKARAAQFDKVVCTDMRFPNEVDVVTQLGGTTIRVVDPNFVPPVSEHPSEALIDSLPVEFEIENDKKRMTIERLHASILFIVDVVDGRHE